MTTALVGNLGPRERVLAAAAQLFAAQGFRGTPTRRIAQRARVSEVTIFRHFRSKHALFEAVLQERLPADASEWLTRAVGSSLDDPALFTAVITELEEVFTPLVLRLIAFATLEQPELAQRCIRPRLRALQQTLGEHIARRVNDGGLRSVHPEASAGALIALAWYPEFVAGMIGGSEEAGGSAVENHADIWLRGVLADRADVPVAPGGSKRLPAGVPVRASSRTRNSQP